MDEPAKRYLRYVRASLADATRLMPDLSDEKSGFDHGIGHPICLCAEQKHLSIGGARRLRTQVCLWSGRYSD
jgi:hypothetical protein